MRNVRCFRWLMAAAIAASLPVTARAMHGMGGFAGGGPHHSMGGGPHAFMGGGPHGFMGGGPHAFMGPRVGGFGSRHDDTFFAHRFAGHNQFFPHNRSFTRNQVLTRDQVIANNQVVVNNKVIVKNQVFPNRRFFFAFDFVSFGFPWWYPYAAYYPYPYYGPPYDYSYNQYGPAYDYQYWSNLAVSVQSELAQRGYYHGPLDGVIGSDSRRAIRAFQAAQGLPVTGVIDPKLLNALGISYRSE